MRLFIAIDFKDQEDYFKELQKQIPTDTANIKNVNVFHLTLKFLGEVEEEKIPKIKEALSYVRFKPFKTNLTNLGYFPDSSYIRVIWVGFEPKEEMIRLEKDVEKVLEEFHFTKDFEFVPHLTLTRVKFVKDKAKFVKAVNQIKTNKVEVEVKEFKLIKSTLTGEGPVYEDLAVFD
jgi:2'-5' RNA ligase